MNFTIIPADTYIWNVSDLNNFLIEHQGQNIQISTNQEGCCCHLIGLYKILDQYKFNSVTILTTNPLETHHKYDIKIELPLKFLNIKKEIEPEYHIWNKTKIFGTIYGRPLWHRIGIASHLMLFHRDASLVGLLSDPNSIDKRKLFEVNELFYHDIASFQNFANIIDQLPLSLNDIDTYTPGQQNTDGYVNQTKRVYKNFLIDVVAETFTTGNTFFPTEKTVRPMLLKKPMLLMTSKDYIDYLLQMGFQTFYEFWDESYDGYEGRERYVRILKIIDDLAKKPVNELAAMYKDMQPILDHNYNLLQTQSYKTTITKVV